MNQYNGKNGNGYQPLPDTSDRTPQPPMTKNTYYTWVITDPTGAVKYIAKPDDDENTAWTIALGWPDDDEIQRYKSQGWRAHIATLTFGTQG